MLVTTVRLVGLMVLCAAPCLAHDFSVDLMGAGTTRSEQNPRSGSLGLGVAGSYDFNDAWSITGSARYTRDLATRTPETFSAGSNVFFFTFGAMWIPTDSITTMLTVLGSPPTAQTNATTVTGPRGRTADVVVRSDNSSFGAAWNGLWTSAPSDFEHTIDVSAGFNRFNVRQQLVLPETQAANLLRAECEDGAALPVCELVAGTESPLWQGRFSVGYVATLFRKTDLGLALLYNVYDTSPTSVGYFSLVALGREVGNGVPVLPISFGVRPQVGHRFGKVSVRLTYQWALYAEDLGTLHLLTTRVNWKVTEAWSLSLTVTGQLDTFEREVRNVGAQAFLSVLYAW